MLYIKLNSDNLVHGTSDVSSIKQNHHPYRIIFSYVGAISMLLGLIQFQKVVQVLKKKDAH